ncbi:MAG: hypothetical protein M4579_003617 [Chaenotheca gracillima]|nr:MAG: hypothetical protein M4579_003617 [Chaenotheca gracillima]
MATPTSSPLARFPRTIPPVRRSATLPITLSGAADKSSPTQDDLSKVVELFAHPSGKIVAFSSPPSMVTRTPPSSGGRRPAESETIGTLPWASRTEKVLCAGPFRIHKAHGVAFLEFGKATHPIFAKSQCWCVDNETKFVLRIRENSYYRIELPNNGPEDRACADKLKEVLPEVLRYEKTACPFRRGFTVELPEEPTTPVKYVPWKPKEKSTPKTPETPPERNTGQHEDVVESADVHATAQSNISNNNVGEGSDSEATDDTNATPTEGSTWHEEERSLEGRGSPSRPQPLVEGRSVTAPALTISTIYPSESPLSTILAPEEAPRDSPSRSSSVDSFKSFHSPISPFLPSPPASQSPSPPSLRSGDDSPELSRYPSHKRDISELTITPHESTGREEANKTPTYFGDRHSPSLPSTPPTLMSDSDDLNEEPEWSETITPSPKTELRQRNPRARTGLSHRRSLSPLPPAANLVFPSSSSSSSSGHHLTTAIIQRTCSLMFGTPLHILQFILQVARRIRHGQLEGIFAGYGESGERIPCHWETSDEEEGSGEDWDEDDYGISLSGAKSKVRRDEVGGSWEVD